MSQTITADKPRRIKPTTLAAIGFAAPLIIYMLIFYVWPLIQNISMSMHRYTRRTFVTGDAPWSGFDIYKEILSNQQFWTILGQTLIFVFASIVSNTLSAWHWRFSSIRISNFPRLCAAHSLYHGYFRQ